MKNPRVLFGLAAFAVTFLLATGIVRLVYPASTLSVKPGLFNAHRFDSALATGLEEFIRRDEANGAMRAPAWANGQVSRRASSEAFDYWETSSAMDAEAFPEDFQIAWREHMNAWKNYALYLEKNAGKEMARSDFISESSPYNDEISRTWRTVLLVARSHGAHVR